MLIRDKRGNLRKTNGQFASKAEIKRAKRVQYPDGSIRDTRGRFVSNRKKTTVKTRAVKPRAKKSSIRKKIVDGKNFQITQWDITREVLAGKNEAVYKKLRQIKTPVQLFIKVELGKSDKENIYYSSTYFNPSETDIFNEKLLDGLEFLERVETSKDEGNIEKYKVSVYIRYTKRVMKKNEKTKKSKK